MPTSPDAQKTYDSSTAEPVQLWKGRISRAEAAQQPFIKKCADWYDLMHARVQESDFEWHSRYFDPVLSAKTWGLVAKLIAGDSGWMVKPKGKTDPLYARAMEETLKYFENNPELDMPMQEKYVISLIDAVVTGVGYQKPLWTIKKKTNQKRIIKDGGVLTGKTEKKEFFLKYPDSINFSVGDILHSPSVSSSSIQKSPYLIFRSYVTLDELKRINAANGGSFYQNLDDVSGFNDFDILTRARNRLIYAQVDPTVQMVEVHECWEKGIDKDGAECVWVSAYANRKTEIQSKKVSPFWHGKYPIVAFRVKPRGFAIEGEGIFETNERGQWAINDTTNHYFDSWNLSNNPGVMQDEDTVVDTYEVMPGFQLLYRGEKPPTPFQFPQPNSQAYDALNQRLMASIETNSISSYQSGIPINAADRTQGTKGGIQAIQQAGDDQLGFYRGVFRQGVKELGVQWMQLIQQYQDEPIITEIMQQTGKVQVEISPDIIQGEMGLDLSETSLQSPNKDSDRQNFDAFVNRLIQIDPVAMQSGAPIAINWMEVIKDMAEKYGASEGEKYVTQGQPPPPPDAASQPAAETPQHPAIKALETLNYKDAPPDIKRQIEQTLGFQPSTMLPDESIQNIMQQHQPLPDLHETPPMAQPAGAGAIQ